jgi:hypothetical protein
VLVQDNCVRDMSVTCPRHPFKDIVSHGSCSTVPTVSCMLRLKHQKLTEIAQDPGSMMLGDSPALEPGYGGTGSPDVMFHVPGVNGLTCLPSTSLLLSDQHRVCHQHLYRHTLERLPVLDQWVKRWHVEEGQCSSVHWRR